MTGRLSGDEYLEQRKKQIEANYRLITEKIAAAAKSSGRNPGEIMLLAATKTVPAALINHVIGLGVTAIGENRVQELLSKYDEIEREGLSGFHFIGHLQTNKVRQIIGRVNMIESVDSVRLAQEISKRSFDAGISTDILLEVNIGKENSKSGFFPEELKERLYEISTLKGITVKGIMSIPPICSNVAQINKFFIHLNKLFIDIKCEKTDNRTIEYLSMGMSSDYEQAVKEGANIVRIGSALFGARI
ncbi:MAG TPA: YggS family pyridoxal phosphate-dependent enzyme [Ruminococcaceae bacterium]|nr:YggS family pyridoxal phosphate-dependent enzyme [Oscillospiraceae bacterium]